MWKTAKMNSYGRSPLKFLKDQNVLGPVLRALYG